MRPTAHRFAPLLALLAALLVPRASLAAASCTNPGKDGPASLAGVVNSYYPGVSGAAGASSVTVGAIDTSGGGSAVAIAAGDLVLVMQMQDADIGFGNDSGYGGSFPGGGQTSLNNAGVYEYASVSLGYAGGTTIALTAPLKNSYRSAAATGAAGQRRFQVIRVPQYSSASLAGTLTAGGWNGATGGVLAIDVGGQLNWNGGALDVTGLGFRGGAALFLRGRDVANTQPAYASTDYVSTLLPLAPLISPNPGATPGPFPGANGTKGEGIAGTPRYLFFPTTARATVNGAGKVFDTGVEGYPGGSMARGAPGNAGGGGTDGDPATSYQNGNDENTGGGGGGGYAIGGSGGFGWTPLTPPGSASGGLGGDGVPMFTGRLTMGGGGGSGTTNNGTGNPSYGLASSGAPGGGVVMVRAKTIIGSGTVSAVGAAGNQTVCNDAGGGGGGGGAVMVYASGNSGNVGAVSINASGGNGGSNTGTGDATTLTINCVAGTGAPHGPGGGGGGGFVALSSIASAAINVSGASGGTTAPSNTSTPPYGSTASPGGYQISTVASTDIPGAIPSPLCFPLVTVGKITAAANTVQGGTTTYSITATNAAGDGLATGLTVKDILPAPFTLASTTSITLAGGATRTSAVDPATGATTPVWGNFSVPGGGSVKITFAVNVPVATATGTYQNPASVTYDDPTRSAAGQTVSPGGTYAGGGFVAGSNYDPASSTAEDVTVRQPATLSKAFTPPSAVAGSTVSLAITLTNPNPVALGSAALTDIFPGGVSATGGAITVTGPGCTGFSPATISAGALQLAVSGGTVPASGACTITTSVTMSSAGAATNTLPAGAFTNAPNVTNTASASATLLARPTVVKSFSPVAVPTNTNSTLSFAITNPNASALTGASFSDPFPSGLVATGGAVSVTGSGCTSFAPSTITANATSFALTAGTLPAATTCTVSFAVKAASAGGYVNTAGGVTTTETVTAGPAPAVAQLGVGLIGVGKAFSPAGIAPGGTSTVTLTLVNPTATAQTAGAFTDTLTGLTAVGGAVSTTCTSITPASLVAGATALSFTNLGIPAAGCTVSFAVTAAASGTKSNTTSGVSTALLPVGPVSNTAALVVAAAPTIAKAFVPATVQAGQASTLTFTLVNANSVPLTGAAFTDTLTVGLQIAATGAAGGSCPGASALSFTAGSTALSFTGLTIPQGAGGCTVTVPVTAASGSYSNTSSGVSSNEAPTSSVSNTVSLAVAAPATITKAFATSPISQGGTSLLTFTLKNGNSFNLTGASFTDALVNMQIAAPGGAPGGTCAGANGSSFATGATALTFNGLTVPTGATGCTVTVTITSSVSGDNVNTASGVTSNETPTAGAGAAATLTVLSPPVITKAFSPSVILATGSLASSFSTLTFTLTNPNAGTSLTGVAFTDALSQMAVAATPTVVNGCGGTASFAAGATSVSMSGVTLAGGASCTVKVRISSAALSPTAGWPNTTSGATSTQTPVAGAVSNTDYLTVLAYAGIAKSFNPTSVVNGGVSTITFTLTNPNSIALGQVSFSDTFPANLLTSAAAQNFIGTGRGNCTGAVPSAAVAASQTTSVSFAGISLPPNSTCTVMVDVVGGNSRTFSNTSSGVIAAETGTGAGPVSNTATFTTGKLSVSKSFNPAAIGVGETSLATFVISNPLATTANTIAFTDTLTGMTVSGAATNGCGGTISGSPGAINYAGTAANTLAAGASCTITVPVTASAAGSFPNTTSAITYAGPGGSPGPVSNTATLKVVPKPTIAKAFSPTSLDAWRNSTLTFTLTNPSATTPLTGCSFTDAFPANLIVSNPPSIGGTCVGVTSTPALALGQTSLNLTVLTLNPGSCTITLPVTTGTASAYSNTASGVNCNETANAGAVSNTAVVTFAKLPIQVTKSASLVKAPPGTAVTYTINYTNPNPAMSLQSIVITDATPQFTSFQSASCAALPASLTSCTVTAPAVGLGGTVTWTLAGTLDPGASGTVSLTVTVN